MRVCTFNLWSDAPRNRRWPARRDGLAAVLHELAPDVAGLQEVTRPMLDDLAARLPEYRWVGVGRVDGRDAGEFTPIFYRAERVILLETACFWLSESSEMPSRGWDAAVPRVVTWGRFREVASGRTFVHGNTHFDHLGRRARRESALLILRRRAEIARGEPFVLTGDLNCREDSAPYRVLTGAEPSAEATAVGRPRVLRDSKRHARSPVEGPERTYLGLLGHFGLGRLDYVFTDDGFQPLRHRVVEIPPGLSDHRPVLVDLAFTDAPP